MEIYTIQVQLHEGFEKDLIRDHKDPNKVPLLPNQLATYA